MQLEDFYIGQLEELGSLRMESGEVIRGSDPELQYDDGHWVLFHTWGPTRPKLSYSPGIYRHIRKGDPGTPQLTGYSRYEQVLNPVLAKEREGEPTIEAFETFSCAHVGPLGRWMCTFTASGPGKRNSRIASWFTRSLLEPGPWPMEHLEREIWPAFDWERQRIGESGICWSDSFGVVCMTYGGKAEAPHQKWATGFMASPDFGSSWHRSLQPFADPPNTFEDGKGINAMSHSTCAPDPDVPYVLHAITTHSGNVADDKKGLIHWIYKDAVWHREPGFLFQPADIGMAHIGGPSLLWDPHGGRWLVAIHADKRKAKIPRHVRLLASIRPQTP